MVKALIWNWLVDIGLVGLGVAAALAVGEGLVRYFEIGPAVGQLQKGRYRLSSIPEIGYEPVPGFQPSSTDLSYVDYLDTVNSLGYRDHEHPKQKRPGVFRAVLLGDSVAAGWGIQSLGDTFGSIVEQQLSEQGMEAEVLNFAVSGYNTMQEVATLEHRALQFDPDFVLLQYSENDEDSGSGILHALVEGTAGSPVKAAFFGPILSRSALFRLLALNSPMKSFFFLPVEEYRLVAGDHRTVRSGLQRLSRISKREKIPMLIVVFPNLEQLESDPRYQVKLPPLPKGSELQVLDLSPGLRICNSRKSIRQANDIWHPNSWGHHCAGNEIAEWIGRFLGKDIKSMH